MEKDTEAPDPQALGKKCLPSGSEHQTLDLGNLRGTHETGPVLTYVELHEPSSSGCKWSSVLRARPPTLANCAPSGGSNIFEMRPNLQIDPWSAEGLESRDRSTEELGLGGFEDICGFLVPRRLGLGCMV